MADEFDNIDTTLKELDVLDTRRIEVGIVNGDEFLSMVAWVNDTGAHIEAKNVPYLVIPYKKDGNLTFIKKKSVNIPARPFLERTIIVNGTKWNERWADLVTEMLNGSGTAKSVMDNLGKQMVTDMREQLSDYIRPHNAPLTIANKGFDDTLMDTGKLSKSIDYRVVTNN